MRVEYLATLGFIQYEAGEGPAVVNCEYQTAGGETIPASGLTPHPEVIQSLASALWAIPETRATTPHKKLVFSEGDYVVRVDGRALPPDADVTGETPEVQTFHQTVYGYNGGEYADSYRLAQDQAPAEVVAPLTPEQEKARQTALIELDFANEVAAIKAGYPADEILSWDQQVLEAKAYQIDAGAATPLLDAMVSTRGGTKADLVTRILANDAAYRQAFGEALGRMQKRKRGLG